MPRYYFHMRSKNDKVQDELGQVLDSTWDAYLRAREIIQKFIQYVDLEDTEQWVIRVNNDADEVELVVLFPKNMYKESNRLTVQR